MHEADYLTPGADRIFESLDAARTAKTEIGDAVLLRDLGVVAPRDVWSTEPKKGRWHLRPYQLDGGSIGRLLMINARDGQDPAHAVPTAFEVPLNLPGPFAIWIGIPRVDFLPRLGYPVMGGVDLALDGDPVSVHIGAERGTRQGKVMGPMNVEVMSFWKCARLDGRMLRIAVPYGTFFSFPWGTVRGSISCIKLVRLSEAQFEAYQRDVSDPATKRVIVVNDGYSHYWYAAEPGSGMDARFVQQYRDSDVKMLMFQSPATGVASWPTKLTSLPGEDVSPEQWPKLRLGDRRAHEYLKWAVKNGQGSMGVVGGLCREAGIEFHPSLRMNLFFRPGHEMFGPVAEYFNGRWWHEHPEARQPGGWQIDYASPIARKFVLDILEEWATQYDPDGINLDFTRWPPIADPARHDFDVLSSFVKEVREMLDRVSGRKKIQLSGLLVDGNHAPGDLAAQKIDLEGWLAAGLMDFIAVQAWDQAKYVELAHRHGVPYYSLQDNDSFRFPRGQDPQWQQADRPDEDPVPGEELEAAPHLNNTLDPTEYDEGFLQRYRLGADGVCVVNNFMGMRSTGRLGHVEEMARRAGTGEVWGQRISGKLLIL